MPTKYEVFAAIIEKAPCTEKQLGFSVRVQRQLRDLKDQGWVKSIDSKYIPEKNETTLQAFGIIKYCMKNNLDYNIFFSKNMPLVLEDLYANSPDIRPKKLKGNKDILNLLRYLQDHQFILVAQKRPARGCILRHQLLEHLESYFSLHRKSPGFMPLVSRDDILKIDRVILNPFGEETFSFLAGNAQLEGATVSEGETRELIVSDIYPDKPAKDIQMVKNLNEALHYVIVHLEEEITTQHIKDINRIVMFGLHRNAGEYKRNQNKIQGNLNFNTTPVSGVPQAMKQYCATLNDLKSRGRVLDDLGLLHNQLQRIHPFSDGNSRTTRMVVNWMLARHHLPILVLKMGSFDEYMSLTKMSSARDDERLKLLMWSLLWHEWLG